MASQVMKLLMYGYVCATRNIFHDLTAPQEVNAIAPQEANLFAPGNKRARKPKQMPLHTVHASVLEGEQVCMHRYKQKRMHLHAEENTFARRGKHIRTQRQMISRAEANAFELYFALNQHCS